MRKENSEVVDKSAVEVNFVELRKWFNAKGTVRDEFSLDSTNLDSDKSYELDFGQTHPTAH
ncbi:MAG: hypothetical protein NTU49_11045 [Gammaproteobacteria bacterium]|nr:hypothetical protein [Gammaproteobacteria bacterium]